MYFSLADDDATLSAVMFKRANQSLEFEPEEGMTVIAEGRLDVYAERGNYQLIAESLQKEGKGELEKEFEELKAKLEQEGALKSSRKRSLPALPETIGVITSGDGAAFWDIVQTIERRCPLVRIVLYPSRVNGRAAHEDISHAIKRLPEIVDLDLLIVGRGGGSPEDLWGFNVEDVARAILDCPVPVISAVGHEVDVTITDLVADHRSPTPTAAGEEAVPELSELEDRVETVSHRLKTAYRGLTDRKRDSVRYLAEKPVFADLDGLLQPYRDNLDRMEERLKKDYKYYVSGRRETLDRLSDKLESLSPENVLDRGYALVKRGQEIITLARQLESGDALTVQFSDGKKNVSVKENTEKNGQDDETSPAPQTDSTDSNEDEESETNTLTGRGQQELDF
ncbi:MAG: exodeoxyribonuclease VII large subunit [bacterium]